MTAGKWTYSVYYNLLCTYKQCISQVAIVRLLHTNSDHLHMITLSICIFLHVMVATLMNLCRHTECMQNIHLNGNRRVKCYHISKSYSTLRAFIILTLNCFSPLFPDWSISITALFLQLVRYLDTVCWQWNTYRYILPIDGYTTHLPL